MPTLLLRMAGPVQNYAGYRLLPNNFPIATAPVPRKSAVAGLLGAAEGRRDLDVIAREFGLHVRVDRTNGATEDLQVLVPLPDHVHETTDRAEKFRQASVSATARHRDRTGAVGPKNAPGTALVNRDFLPHAEFMCAIDGSTERVGAWLAALQEPRFMTFLGRRANAPVFPFILGISDDAPVEVLTALPRVPRAEEIPWGSEVESVSTRVRLYEVVGNYDLHEHRPVSRIIPPSSTREEQIAWLRTHLSR